MGIQNIGREEENHWLETSRIFSKRPYTCTALPSKSTHLPEDIKLPFKVTQYRNDLFPPPDCNYLKYEYTVGDSIKFCLVHNRLGTSLLHRCSKSLFLLASFFNKLCKDEHCTSVSSLNYLFHCCTK